MSNDEDEVCFLCPPKNIGTSIIMRMSGTNQKERRTRKPNFAREVLAVHSKSLKQREQVALGVGIGNPERPVRLGCRGRKRISSTSTG